MGKGTCGIAGEGSLDCRHRAEGLPDVCITKERIISHGTNCSFVDKSSVET